MDELFNQTRAVYVNEPIEKREVRQADRLQRHSRRSTSSWTTAPPRKSGRWWSRPRRSSIPKILVTATCVRVPVFIGHSEAVLIEFERPISEAEARASAARRARRHRGRSSADEGYVTPVEAAGEDRSSSAALRDDPRSRTASYSGAFRRQPAQGCRPQRGPDRRSADRPLHAQGGVNAARAAAECTGAGRKARPFAFPATARRTTAGRPRPSPRRRRPA